MRFTGVLKYLIDILFANNFGPLLFSQTIHIPGSDAPLAATCHCKSVTFYSPEQCFMTFIRNALEKDDHVLFKSIW